MSPTKLSLLALTLSTSVFAANPPYHKPEGYNVPGIRIRADSRVALNIPSKSYFGLEDPLFLENQDILCTFLVYAGQVQSGIFRFSQELGSDALLTPAETFLSRPTIDPLTGDIVFEQLNYGYFSEGIMSLSSDFKSVRRSFYDRHYQFTSLPQSISPSKQRVVVREEQSSAEGQGLSLLENNGSVTELLESSVRDPKSPYSYLFSHSAHASGLVVLKVRHGRSGEISESQGDEILLIDLRTTPFSVTSLMKDNDLDPSSIFKGFDNMGALNANGDVSWITRLKSGHRALVFKAFGKEPRVLVEEKLSEISQFSNFHISMNARSEIVFRATDKAGLEGVWRTNAAGKLYSVVRQGDRLKTDQGAATVGVRGENAATIFMSPQINNSGDILFGAFLTKSEDDRRDIGMGYFVVEPLQ